MAKVLNQNQLQDTPQTALAHYGVKGMQWGVRKKDSRGSTRKEARQERRNVKAKVIESRAAKADIRIQEITDQINAIPNKGAKNRYVRSDLRTQRDYVTQERDHLLKTAESLRAGKLTPTQKKVLVSGTVAAGLVLATYGASKAQSGELNALKLRGQALMKGEKFDFRRNEAFAGKMSANDVLKNVVPGINPNYAKSGGQMNCRRCSFTYELRRRGYDVSATASSLGYGQSETGLINALTPGKRNVNRAASLSEMVVSNAKGIRGQVKRDSRSNPASLTSVKSGSDRLSLLNALKQQPDGARGEAVFNFGSFGHSLSYERFGNKIYLFDTQKGKRYSLDSVAEYDSFINKWGRNGNTGNVEITRLDNVPLDHKFLARWATNRKD